MNKTVNTIFFLMVAGSLTVAIWSFGWYLYDIQTIWETIENYNYEKILYALIGTIDAIIGIVAIKSKRSLTNLDRKQLNQMFDRATSKIAPKVQKLENQVEDIEKEIRDLKLAFKSRPAEVKQK